MTIKINIEYYFLPTEQFAIKSRMLSIQQLIVNTVLTTSNKRPPPILAKKYCVGLIALELAPTVNYWFKGEIEIVIVRSH